MRPTVAARRRRPTPMTVLAVASIGVFMAFLDTTIVNIAFPDIAGSFPQASIDGLSWILTVYFIVLAASLMAAGRIADLIGRRRVFMFGLVLFTLASVLAAVAPSVGVLVLFRAVQALGAAAMVPAALGLVLDAFPRERAAHAVALLSAVGALASAIGPSLGGVLVAAESWRLVFLVNLPIGVVAYALSRRHLIEGRTPGWRRMPDLLGSLVFAGAISALVLAVLEGSDWGWSSVRVLAAFGVALVLGAWFVRRCARHRSPIIDPQLLRTRALSVANAMTVVAAAGLSYSLANVLFLTQVWRYSELDAGLAITPSALVGAAVAGPASRVAERLGQRPVLVVGGLVSAAGALWLATQVGVTPEFVSEWLPGMILLGLGGGIMIPNLSGTAISSAPGQGFATATALNGVARMVGGALGVAAVVTILSAASPLDLAAAYDRAWVFAAAAFFVATAGSLGLGRLRAQREDERTPSLGSAVRGALEAAEQAAPAPPPSRVPAPPPAAPSPPDRPESSAEFLSRVPLFADLDTSLRDVVAERAGTLRLPAGEWLFREGDPGDAMYVVRAGRLEVVAANDSVLRELGRGDAVGELAIVTGTPRSASVRAARDTDLIVIERSEFERLLHEGPELSLALNRVLGRQLRESRGVQPAARPLPVTVALVPLDDRVPVGEIADRLAAELGRRARVAKFDGSEASPHQGADPVSLYGPLLDRAEHDHDSVLLVAGSDFESEPWGRFCIQQADRILALSSGQEVPANGRARPELRGCDLVACDVERGAGLLAAWVAKLDPIETHALHSGARLGEGIERLARRLTGRSVGIVLSGGGARAFSHIGVLEELAAADIPIDRVGGVSMGALLGGMLAIGMEPDEIDAHVYEEWVRRRPIGDVTLPRYSLIRGARVREMVEGTFGEIAIEELERSFFAASTDLRASELVVHRHGPMAEAIVSSASLPVLTPPQVRDRQILVDGSLVDNLPVATMAALGEGPIIAVDVKASFDPSGGRARAGVPEPRRGVEDEGENGSAERAAGMPGLGETLTRIFLLASSNTSESARRHADLVINPRNEGVGLLEFHQLDQAREAGRAAAREALARAPAQLWS